MRYRKIATQSPSESLAVKLPLRVLYSEARVLCVGEQRDCLNRVRLSSIVSERIFCRLLCHTLRYVIKVRSH